MKIRVPMLKKAEVRGTGILSRYTQQNKPASCILYISVSTSFMRLMQHTSMMKINSSNQAFTLWHLSPLDTRGCPGSQHMLKTNTQHISSSTNKTFIDWGRDSLVAVISWNNLIWTWYHQAGLTPPNSSGFTHCETLSSSHTTVNPSENNEDLQHAG